MGVTHFRAASKWKLLESMELKSTKASPVLADPAPIDNPRMGIRSGRLPYSQTGPSFSTSVSVITRKKPGKIDDVRSNGWLDAMQSSSPPHKKIMKDINAEFASDDGDMTYRSWMVIQQKTQQKLC